jgi:hypothetical protein
MAIAGRAAGPTGVAGWLLFFCLASAILRPLAIIGLVMPTLKATSPYTYMVLALTAFGMILGTLLWMGKPEALPYVRLLLGSELILIAVRVVRTFMMHLPSPNRSVLVAKDVTVAFIPVLWYVYFRTSRRVRNTYGRNI